MAVDREEVVLSIASHLGTVDAANAAIKAVLDGLWPPSDEMVIAAELAVRADEPAFPAMIAAERARLFPEKEPT